MVVAPYGTWESPITTDLLAGKEKELLEIKVDVSSCSSRLCKNERSESETIQEPSGKIYLIEGRPAENGRCVIVELDSNGDASRDVLPAIYNARTAVHEYGGAAFAASPSDGNLIFSDWETRQVFSLNPSSNEIQPATKSDPELRYASFSVHPTAPNWILAIQEDHHQAPASVENSLVVIDTSSIAVHNIASGADFYNHPQFSPQGDMLCWIQWNHPDMPWTGTTLHTAQWQNGKIVGSPRHIAGRAGEESIVQPRWGLDGTLFFSSDRSGYWQLYRLKPGASEAEYLHLKDMEDGEFAGQEFGLGRYRSPGWALIIWSIYWWPAGSCTHVPLSRNTLLAAYQRKARSHLIIIDLQKSACIDLGSEIDSLVDVKKLARISDTSFAVIGSTPRAPAALYFFDTISRSLKMLQSSSEDVGIPNSLYSTVQHISFPRVIGDYKKGDAHGIFLRAHNPSYTAPSGSLPPLIVHMHGGPTAHVSSALSMSSQYWTSRGYSYVSVNYAGSTSYGREYRDLLNGRWGVLDVADAASCAAYLSATSEGSMLKDQVDPTRIGICGESSGGYGVLQSLCDYSKIWAGGVSIYGISSLRALLKDTHKYESRYMFSLLFNTAHPSPEEEDEVFESRSPLNHASHITAPLLLLQGDKDTVVPPSQTEEMEKKVLEAGGRARTVMFEGEGHGFRQGKNVKRAFEEEERWFRETLVEGERTKSQWQAQYPTS